MFFFTLSPTKYVRLKQIMWDEGEGGDTLIRMIVAAYYVQRSE